MRITVANEFKQVAQTLFKVPPHEGVHYWIIMTTFSVDPMKIFENGEVLLDHENLVSVSYVGCYHCHEPYSKSKVGTRCVYVE